MLPRLAIFVAFGVFAAQIVAAPPPESARRLKGQIEVSKKVAGLFSARDGKVLLKNGAEITLFRDLDVEIVAIDRPDFHFEQPDPKPAVDLLLQVQLSGEFPGLLANRPVIFGKFWNQGLEEGGMHVPDCSFNFRCYAPATGAGAGGGFQGQANCKEPPGPADWEKARLMGLGQLDDLMREWLGAILMHPARLVYHEKAGWYLQNPYPFVVSGKTESALSGRDGKQTPFCLAPKSKRLWVSAERFAIRDLTFSPVEKAK